MEIYILKGGNMPEAVLDACLPPREGGWIGYPDKLKGDGISVIART